MLNYCKFDLEIQKEIAAIFRSCTVEAVDLYQIALIKIIGQTENF